MEYFWFCVMVTSVSFLAGFSLQMLIWILRKP